MTGRILRRIAAAMFLILIIGTVPAGADEDDSAGFVCRENRVDCLLIQAVMAENFEDFNSDDSLTGRIYASVYPMLSGISGEAVTHYCEEFDEDEDEVEEEIREALVNCLYAYIESDAASENGISAEERVLLLFLDPEEEKDAKEQMKEIRERITDEMTERIAGAVEADPDFIRWLIFEFEEAFLN